MDKTKFGFTSAPETEKLTPHAKKSAPRTEGTDMPMSPMPPQAVTDSNNVPGTGRLSSNRSVSRDAQQVKTNTERISQPYLAQSHQPTANTQRSQQPMPCPFNAFWTRALELALHWSMYELNY